MCRFAEMGLHPDKQAGSETQARHHRHAACVRVVASACGDVAVVGAMT